MIKKLLACIVFYCVSITGYGQLNESFTDGDFTNNPTWTGGSSDWLVNAAFQLQSNNLVASSTYYLSTASTKATTAQWEFSLQLDFNTSSANYVDVFLIASASDLTQSTTTGYFLRMGGTDDEIALYRKDGGTSVKIIDGINAALNNSSNNIKVKVVRDASNQWSLSRDVNNAGLTNEGIVTDATFLTSAFFGILVKQSTASFFQKHFFDDIIVGDFVPDVIPPAIQTLTAVSITTVDVLFNEPVELVSSQLISNYVVDNGIGNPTSAIRDASNAALVHLAFASNFPANQNLLLTINGVTDLASNTATNLTDNFTFTVPQQPQQYDIVIDELMADPDPVVGLPGVEWLEIKNTTGANINLLGWTVGKASGQSGPMPSYILKPDSFLIVCTGSAVAALSAFGPTISVTSFPSLSNSGDLLNITSPAGTVIHSVNYTDAWYQNELKKAGGWSLEMIDTNNPCSGISNWKASEDPSGGTPGRKNSVDAVNPDINGPKVLRAYATDSVNITVVFDEAISGAVAANPASYSISNGIGNPVSAILISPVFDKVTLTLATSLQRNTVYTITVSGITDCAGNTVGGSNSVKVGLTENADSFDIVINEILFNPTSASNDYVELYNRSNKIINLKNVYIANRNSTGVISSITQLSTDDYPFFPQDFIVVTDSKLLVLAGYVANNPDAFVEVSMPSFNDDEGNVIILNEQGRIVDQLSYSDDWQFELITNVEGVSLERIDYNAPTQNRENWHSAATNIGYGTPTYKNSQSRIDAGLQGEITIDPAIFSPDNDGRDDVATINYNFPEPGYVTNITIFDAVGRPVRYLQRNALSAVKGYYRWDGLDEKNQKLQAGIYVIYTEVFNLKGKTRKFKKTIVLAKKQ